jgi:hypothetical protein
MIFQQLVAATLEPIGTPGPLPADLDGLDAKDVLDLSWIDANTGWRDKTFWPVDAPPPAVPEAYTAEIQLVQLVPAIQRAIGAFAPKPLEERKAALLAAVRDARWRHEQAGFTGPNGRVRPDDATQAKVTGAVQLFALRPTLIGLDWELAPGVFATVSRADVEAMGVLIGLHVQACFTRSRQLSEAVLAATTHAELDLIDLEDGWPT